MNIIGGVAKTSSSAKFSITASSSSRNVKSSSSFSNSGIHSTSSSSSSSSISSSARSSSSSKSISSASSTSVITPTELSTTPVTIPASDITSSPSLLTTFGSDFPIGITGSSEAITISNSRTYVFYKDNPLADSATLFAIMLCGLSLFSFLLITLSRHFDRRGTLVKEDQMLNDHTRWSEVRIIRDCEIVRGHVLDFDRLNPTSNITTSTSQIDHDGCQSKVGRGGMSDCGRGRQKSRNPVPALPIEMSERLVPGGSKLKRSNPGKW